MHRDGGGLLTPGHWTAEVATALWAKSAIDGVMSRQDAIERIVWIGGVAVEVVPVDRLIVAATGIAFDLHATAFDTLYLALAEHSGTALVTADRKLYEKAKAAGRFADLVVWVGDLSAGSGSQADTNAAPVSCPNTVMKAPRRGGGAGDGRRMD